MEHTENQEISTQGLHDRHTDHVAATYKSYADAEKAVEMLLERQIPAQHISLVGKNFSIEDRPLGFTTIRGVAKEGSKFGALWGGMLGLLLGFTVFFAPVTGPLLLFGPIAYALTSAVEGALFGGLAGLLVGWGLKHEKAVQFERSIKEGEYLVMVSGPSDLVTKAYYALQQTNCTQIEIFDNSSVPEDGRSATSTQTPTET
ncbi:general stress protein [Alicyclobacillus acidocaldarius]|uniref:Putative permease n=1 Tax=Alicyclobacillus acidocaldarius subsp. acidocaldarius (strain ATCC 27009 / DSM 446 / BCRC 14685 / JCM 5260 / KCTC 1825 / NBRC 15652 / NCIMB 11725 / NRRL B-14509 / 104-IA) TaxID=521098 RepID=C8WVH0_ALIAD|nr:general stress protein [Alicyclobacillus acidocaldarius]ACV58092.1 putative permease [Alicyclobacillus acidocaldarius subsp. acidocaldarius DSM 446]